MIKQELADKETIEFRKVHRDSGISTKEFIKLMSLITIVFFCFTLCEASHDKAADREKATRETCA
jgi:hypothetical protein